MPTQQQSYRAIIQGSQITWIDAPPNLPFEAEVQVAITQAPSKELRGRAMAAALEKLAQLNPLGDIDPVMWQQEIRQEKMLPGRE